MGIMNRSIKSYPLEKGIFPENLILTHNGKKRFYFGECFYADSELDEIFISYKAFPWEIQEDLKCHTK